MGRQQSATVYGKALTNCPLNVDRNHEGHSVAGHHGTFPVAVAAADETRVNIDSANNCLQLSPEGYPPSV